MTARALSLFFFLFFFLLLLLFFVIIIIIIIFYKFISKEHLNEKGIHHFLWFAVR